MAAAIGAALAAAPASWAIEYQTVDFGGYQTVNKLVVQNPDVVNSPYYQPADFVVEYYTLTGGWNLVTPYQGYWTDPVAAEPRTSLAMLFNTVSAWKPRAGTTAIGGMYIPPPWGIERGAANTLTLQASQVDLPNAYQSVLDLRARFDLIAQRISTYESPVYDNTDEVVGNTLPNTKYRRIRLVLSNTVSLPAGEPVRVQQIIRRSRARWARRAHACARISTAAAA